MTAHDQRALKFEQQAQDHTAAALKLALADAARRLAAEYIKAVGKLDQPVPPTAQSSLRAALRRIVTALATGMVSELPALISALTDIAEQGLRLGAHASPGRPRRTQLAQSAELRAAIRRTEKTLRDQIAEMQQQAAAADLRTFGDVTTVIAKGQQVVNKAQAAAAWAANRAVNEGARAVADRSKSPVLWVAEPGACLTCLAYAGHLAEPGEPFPAGLTFGDKSTVDEPIDGPPAHPWCRCRLQPWYGTEPQFGVELPTALKREAQRQVLRGKSLYASRPAKLRAADRLLKTSLSGLPEHVKLTAAHKVQAGVMAWALPKRPHTTKP